MEPVRATANHEVTKKHEILDWNGFDERRDLEESPRLPLAPQRTATTVKRTPGGTVMMEPS
jgi:hypothetical protein